MGIGTWASAVSSLDSFDENHSSNHPHDAWEVTQEMGEVLLIPPGWWHQTLHQDRTLAVMSQFVTEALLPLIAAELQNNFGMGEEMTCVETQCDPRKLVE